MASNFRAADQVYIPVAGHVASANATFVSDVWLSNVSLTDGVTVSVIYVPQGQGGIATCAPAGTTNCFFDNVITLRPGERKEIVDFFPTALGQASAFGSLIFNGCLQNADCIGTQDANGNSINFRDIVVESRIYSIPAGQTNPVGQPTNGQDMPGIPWYNFVSSRQASNGLGEVFITGLRNTGTSGQTGTFRGNIGLMNASQFSTTTMVVKLFNGATGQQIGSDFTTTLGPLASVQNNVSAMFSAFGTGATSTNAFVTISQTNSQPTSDAPSTCLPDGCPGFLAYGSVLDNATQDATTLEAVYEKSLSGTALDVIYGAGSGKSNLRHSARHGSH
ncbi:MAG TPA: hypothetical protein VF980_03530 [Thermoanaerobaculia bacterium]